MLASLIPHPSPSPLSLSSLPSFPYRRLRPESAGRDDRTGELPDRVGRPAAEGRTGGGPRLSRDSILGAATARPTARPFDFVVGNPPWIAWDNLPDDYRRATKPLWERYGLFSLSGNEARHGGGKKDLSMLMLYAAADRYLKPGGRLGMVITQTSFKPEGPATGFAASGSARWPAAAGVARDDMVALRPFGDAANWTSTIVLEKGAATEYPVPYFEWGEGNEERE